MEDRQPTQTELPVSKHAGRIEVLGRRAMKHLAQHKSEDETLKFSLQGVGGQAIVALDERLLVIKPGWEAGAAFGARVTSFYYGDITGIEVNTGLMMGVIEINSPSYQRTGEKDYWSGHKDKVSLRVTNCLPTNKTMLKEQGPYLDELRRLIRVAKSGQGASGEEGRGSAPFTGSVGGADELEKLATLKERGILTEEEFAV